MKERPGPMVGSWVARALAWLLVLCCAGEARALQLDAAGHGGASVGVAAVAQGPLVGSFSVRELEDDLGAGTTGLLRATSKTLRQIAKVVKAAGGRWLDWLGGLILFSVLAVLAGVMDGELLLRWQQHGLRAFLSALWLGCVVFLRLIFDSSTPAIGKLLLAFSLLYAVAPVDLSPDSREAMGWVDDLSLIYLAARNFMLACPEDTIERHARAAANAGDRAR